MARGKKVSNLYVLQAKLSSDITNAIQDDATVELWHKRLAQMSEKKINYAGEDKCIEWTKKYTSKKVYSLFVWEAEQRLIQEFSSFEKARNTGFNTFRFVWSYEDENT